MNKALRNVPSTPLGTIGLFLAVTEVVLWIAATQLDGQAQLVVVYGAIVLPILTTVSFFVILWAKPYSLYPPSEYGSAEEARGFVDAYTKSGGVQPHDADASDEQILAERVFDGAFSEMAEENDVDDAEEETPPDDEITWILAFRKGEYAQAIEILDQIIAQPPDDMDEFQLRTSRAYVQAHIDHDEGVEALEQLKIDNQGESSTYYHLATLYERSGQVSRAIEVLKSGILNVANSKKGELQTRIADILVMSESSYQEALNATIELRKFEITPERRAYSFRLEGHIHNELGNSDDADAAYLKAFDSAPMYPFNLEKIAEYYEKTKRRQGLFLRKRLVDLQPKDPSHWVVLGNSYLINGYNDLAMTSYRKALELSDSQPAWIIGNMGNLYNNVGLHSLAVTNLEEAVKLDPSSQFSHERLADAMKKRDAEAEKAEEEISRSNPATATGRDGS